MEPDPWKPGGIEYRDKQRDFEGSDGGPLPEEPTSQEKDAMLHRAGDQIIELQKRIAEFEAAFYEAKRDHTREYLRANDLEAELSAFRASGRELLVAALTGLDLEPLCHAAGWFSNDNNQNIVRKALRSILPEGRVMWIGDTYSEPIMGKGMRTFLFGDSREEVERMHLRTGEKSIVTFPIFIPSLPEPTVQSPKPCPSCKSMRVESYVVGINIWKFACVDCGVSGPKRDTEAEALTGWNEMPRKD